jgi:para-aminobenzoate synthetase/4-amino-4-deoxychorismate lyase
MTRVRLGPGPAPVDVLRALAGAPGLVCLVGDWAGGGAIVASHPTHTATDARVLSRPVTAPSDGVGGGWFGWLAFSGVSHLGWYDHVLRLVDGEWWFEALGESVSALEERRRLLTAEPRQPTGPAPSAVGPFVGPDPAQHLAAVEEAIGAIRAGDLYQVNVCTRLHAAFAGSGVDVFARLAELRPAFAAYLSAAGREILSASPELFLRRRGRAVVTKPIKGTLPRVPGNDAALRRSAKDAAENVMIVDLMRNDLGRVCATGSVRASALLEVEPHPGVWHLVSTVTGELRDGIGDAELLDATFPPGSVTGAPKLRALAEIGAVEGCERGVYTGAIGFASPAWGSEFSVAIRTFELTGERIELGVGGGITADSVPMLEWRECLDKAAPLLGALGADGPSARTGEPEPWQRDGGLLETVLVRAGVPQRLADHLARLDRSSRELYGRAAPELSARVHAAAADMRLEHRAVLRIVLAADATVTFTCAALRPPPEVSDLHVVQNRPGVWRHKWADRRRLTADEVPGMPLYVADDGTVLETSRGNVFLVARDGTLTTPPLRDDLLPGVMRRAVLDFARDSGWPVAIRPFDLGEMLGSAAFWTSSLSGAVPIHAIDGTTLPRLDGMIDELAQALFVR